jgi:hypothetical protein
MEPPLDEFPNIVVRKDHKYGGSLRPGVVELIGDYMIYSQFFEKGNVLLVLRPYCFERPLWLPGMEKTIEG